MKFQAYKVEWYEFPVVTHYSVGTGAGNAHKAIGPERITLEEAYADVQCAPPLRQESRNGRRGFVDYFEIRIIPD